MPISYTTPLTVIDIRGFLLRSYWASKKSLREDTGVEVPTWEGGLATFVATHLLPILSSTPPRKVIAVADAGNEYRTSLYPSYKGRRKARAEKNRADNPISIEQIKTLMEKAQEFLINLGVKWVFVPGQEADDVIALLSQRLDQQITIYSVDADLLQLVSNKASAIIGDQWYQKGDKYKGVPTDLIVLNKSMVGDSSDEYPGVANFGAKSWSSLEREFGEDALYQLDACVKSGNYAALEEAVASSAHPLLTKLYKNKSAWKLSYTLATLRPEVCYGSRKGSPLKPVWKVRIPNQDKVHQILMQAKAPDLMEHLVKHFPTFTLITANNHETLRDAAAKLNQEELVAFDFESYDSLQHQDYKIAAKSKDFVDVLSQKITGISFCTGANFQDNYYVSIDHADTANLSEEWAVWLLNALYTAKNLPVVQNASFELSVSKAHLNLDLEAPYDTQILQSYVDENASPSLKDMTKERFNYPQKTYEEVTEGKPMNALSADHVLQYGCEDSLVTAFHFDLQNIITQLEGSWEFYESQEVVHVKDSVSTFISGTDIDFTKLKQMGAEDRRVIEEKSEAIRKSLEENCLTKSSEQQTKDAQNLLDLWWEFESAKLQDKGAGQDEINSRYQQLWEKAWFSSVYTPYTETAVSQEFIPTKTKINNLLGLLDSPLRVEKATKTYLTEWLVVNDTEIDSSAEKVRTFVHKLAAATDNLTPKKRKGEAYESLKDYAQQLLNENTTTHKVTSDGDELNFGSSPQMVEFLYGKLGLSCRARSKFINGSTRDSLGVGPSPATGNKASAAAIVHDLQGEADWRKQVIMSYMDVVTATQNVSLYYKPYPLWKSPVDGKIHPQIRNCGTVTRRPSGTSPNVLQVSAKAEARIRQAYVPPSKKYAYVCLDFNGQELRITASESQDRELVAAYVGDSKKDIHSLTASGFANTILPREGLTQFSAPMDYQRFVTELKEGQFGGSFNHVRKLAKAVNFLIIYGGGYTTLATNLLISVELAKSMMSNTFDLYSGLKPWQRRVIEFALSHGYVETAYKNRRHLTRDLYSSDDFLRMRQERQAVNATIQGCAADILKVVLSGMRRRKIVQRYGLKALKPVYDEIAACVLVEAIPDYIEEMKEVMEVTPPGHIVPMEVEAAIGLESWGGKIELGRPTREQVVEFLKEHG